MTNNDHKQTPQQILKRIEKESAEDKLKQTMRILQREEVRKSHFQGWWPKMMSVFKSKVDMKKKEFIKMSLMSQNRHIAIVTGFFFGAVLVSWKIEEKYDRMRERAKGTQSMKQIQVQTQNDYIQKMLNKNPFQPVPIDEQEQTPASYIYQKAQIEFDTRADLLQVMQEQHKIFDIDADDK